MAFWGGAITVNSADFTGIENNDISSDKPFLVIYDNEFDENSAYLSGNAVFVRATKRDNDMSDFCVGSYFYSNRFIKNFGFKLSNGGAVTTLCDHINSSKENDYYHFSGYVTTYKFIDLGSLVDGVDDLFDGTLYSPLAFGNLYDSNTFSSNFAGRKGTAIFSKYISRVKI